MKKMISFVSAITIFTLFTGCSERKDTRQSNETRNITQTMYKEERISFSDDTRGYASLISLNNSPAMICFTEKGFMLKCFDSELNIIEEKLFYKTEEPAFYSFRTEANGDIYGAFIRIEADDSLIGTDEYFETAESRCSILRWNRSGELISETEIINFEDIYTYGKDILTDVISYGEKYILQFSLGIALVGKNGEIEDYKEEFGSNYAFGKDTERNTIISDAEGFSYMDEFSLKIPESTVKFDKYVRRIGSIFSGTDGFKAYFTMNDGIFGLTSSDEFVKIVDFRQSQVTGSELTSLVYLEQGKFLAAGYESDTGQRYLSTLTVRPDDYIDNRERKTDKERRNMG